jgi:hypothetical protein
MFGDEDEFQRLGASVPTIPPVNGVSFVESVMVDTSHSMRPPKGKARMQMQTTTAGPFNPYSTPFTAPVASMIGSTSTGHFILQAPPQRFTPVLNPTAFRPAKLPGRRDPEICEDGTISPALLRSSVSYADVGSVEQRRNEIPHVVVDTFNQINRLRKECLDVIAHSLSLPSASGYLEMLQCLEGKHDLPRGHLANDLVYPSQRPDGWYFLLLKDRLEAIEEQGIKTGEEGILKGKLGLLLTSMRRLMAYASEEQLRAWWKAMVMPLELPSRFQNGFVKYKPMKIPRHVRPLR